ncbi:hypothetical protein [Planktothrix mougeotii]|uniref:Transposase n=1 Tax=Planktothrix mougeotii LEGE 06226 TaxID=1828728 RepID=A0ABR9UEI7_9CYAN|nr:hypothetical protein [Planktothrix mougeotii]MBE9144876.1 hypothetical protein [Planktothrix mougeotii LEGE 06226]
MIILLLLRVAFSGKKKSNIYGNFKNGNDSHIKNLAPFGKLSDILGYLPDTSGLDQVFHVPLIIQIVTQFPQSLPELWGLTEMAIATFTITNNNEQPTEASRLGGFGFI